MNQDGGMKNISQNAGTNAPPPCSDWCSKSQFALDLHIRSQFHESKYESI